ncbi:hypothetical protein H9P43_004117 [Blastocladiella emersonii ATCC 22665]|nr:hypothetical protein H9P43_004117 [Blastocladiella emersonii ATCC 22665]
MLAGTASGAAYSKVPLVGADEGLLPTSAATTTSHDVAAKHRPSSLTSRCSDDDDLFDSGLDTALMGSCGDNVPFERLQVLDEAPKSSVLGAVLNFTNSIIGAGIIGLPYAFRQAGFVLGLGLLVVLAFVVAWTVVLLAKCGKLSSTSSYQALVDATFGGRGQFLIAFFQFIFAFGAMCAYQVIIGDTLPTVMTALLGGGSSSSSSEHWFLARDFIIVVTTLLILLPLSLQRDMSAMSKTSAVSMASIIMIVLTVIYSAIRLPAELRGDPAERFTVVGENPIKAIGVISFAFISHHYTFIVLNSLDTPTLDRFARVTNLSAGISLVACALLAVTGFVTFTSSTQGNVLNNFPSDDLGVNLARLAFALNMFTTYPMEVFVSRHVLEDYFFPTTSSGGRTPTARHVAWTLGVVAASTLIAVATSDLSAVLEATGGIAATAIAYILPPWCWLKLSKVPGPTRYACYACLAFGAVVMVLSMTT